MTESTNEPIPSRSKQRWARSKKSRGEYAQARRFALLRILAPTPEGMKDCGECAHCKAVKHYTQLEIDHVDGRSWKASSLNRWARIARMWREHNEGVRLRALCRGCNASEGGGRRYGRSPR